MACNNAWANARLLAACETLGAAEFSAERSGFFPSIRETLNHSLTVDWYYIDAIERTVNERPPNENPAQFFDVEQPFFEVAALAGAQRSSDLRLIDCIEKNVAMNLSSIVQIKRAKRDFRETLERTLAHLFQHQIHHRGQVHAMLSSTSVAPPQLDEFFCSGEAHLREKELAGLGLSEERVWGPDALRGKHT